MSVASNVVPHFIKAKTPEQLQRKMAQLAAIRQTHIPFFDIQRADGFWFAWYNSEMSRIIKMENKNGISEKL